MTPFDLLFIVLFLSAIGVLIAASVAAARGRRATALRRLRGLVIGAAVYLLVVTLGSLVSRRRIVDLGADECSDDWCIAVTRIDRIAGDSVSTYRVAFRISSRAGRVSQRERFVIAYLVDETGRRYRSGPQDGEAPFDTLLRPGGSIMTTRMFVVPRATPRLGVVVAREGGFDFPGCCILGQGVFRKYPITFADRQ